MAFQVTIVEILIFQLGALIIGFVLHYLWGARHSLSDKKVREAEAYKGEAQEWRLKYYEFVENNQEDLEQLRKELKKEKQKTKETEDELLILKADYDDLQQQYISATKEMNPAQYIAQLKEAQDHLIEHNGNVQKLLQQIEMLEQQQQQYVEIEKANEALKADLLQMKEILAEKEIELSQMRRKTELTDELRKQLQHTHDEFNQLQEKLRSVEYQLAQPTTRTFEYRELEQLNQSLQAELHELRRKSTELTSENQHFRKLLSETEDRLREANFHKQQLTKKNEFLEELNKNLQYVTEHNKKLEGELQRLSEIEALLARISRGEGSEPGL